MPFIERSNRFKTPAFGLLELESELGSLPAKMLK
jgi:hypothetical protein